MYRSFYLIKNNEVDKIEYSIYKNDEEYSKEYKRYYHFVFAIAKKQIYNIDDAEDIVQNVFITYYEKKDTIKKTRQWLAGTCRFEIKNYLRKKNPFVDIDTEIWQDKVSSKTLFDETCIVINDAMSSIKDDDKLLFNMIAISNIPFTKAADIFGLTIRRIRYRYYNIELTILDNLRKYGVMKLDDLL